jgi:hypothetical protein
MLYKIIEVEGYCGFRINERPISFKLENRREEVNRVIDRWYEGGKRAGGPIYTYFRVLTKNDEIFILRYNSRYKTWAVKIN